MQHKILHIAVHQNIFIILSIILACQKIIKTSSRTLFGESR